MSLANMLEMPLNKVGVMNPYIGGSFGRGNEADQPFLVFTALLAKRNPPAAARCCIGWTGARTSTTRARL